MERWLGMKMISWGLAVAAGILWAISLPTFSFAGGAYLAPALMLLACREERRGWGRFIKGWCSGLVGSLISLDWLLNIPFPKGAIAGWIALSAYAAVYPAIWCLLSRQKDETGGWGQRQKYAIHCALVWVGLEWLRSHLMGGFPVNLLGVSQYRNIPLIQISSITGVYGVSFLVVWFSVSLVNVVEALKKNRAYRGLMGEIAIPILVLLGASIWGMGRVRHAPAPDRFVKLSLIQPAIPQELIFDPGEVTNRFEELLKLSEKALEPGSQCLIWPEAAMPQWTRENYAALTHFVAQKKVPMILGCDDAESENIDGKPHYKFYNAAYLFDENGQQRGTYRKKRLVIFGEYVPLLKWVSFLKYLTPIESSYEAGEKSVSFEIPGSDVRCSVLICFEDFFPHGGPEAVFPDTDFLLNLTNDGWFKEGMMQWQHAINGMFRAVENGVPLVRSTNNGLTCWIDSYGRIRQVFRDGKNSVYGTGVFNIELPMVSSKYRMETFYHRHGDWFSVGAALILALTAIRYWKENRRVSRENSENSKPEGNHGREPQQ